MAYADLSTRKTQARLSATLNESASDASHLASSSFARRQLEKMGWTEGTGLGKKRDGVVVHIRAKKREETVGLGSEKKIVEEASDTWWRESVGDTLARLQRRNSDDDKTKKKKKKKKSKKKDKEKGGSKEKGKKKKRSEDEPISGEVKIYSDHDLFVATGGARFGMRAQRRAEAKWSRTESGTKLWEEEVEAKKKLEWNGLGAAKVLLNGSGGTSSEDGSDKDTSYNHDIAKSGSAIVSVEKRSSVKVVAKELDDSKTVSGNGSSEKGDCKEPEQLSPGEKGGQKKKRKKDKVDGASTENTGEEAKRNKKKRRKVGKSNGDIEAEASSDRENQRKRDKKEKKKKRKRSKD